MSKTKLDFAFILTSDTLSRFVLVKMILQNIYGLLSAIIDGCVRLDR